MLRRTLPLVLLTLALLAGCGGDDGPQTKATFINDADDVCEKLADDFRSAGAEQPGTAQEVVDANDTLADLYERLADRLSEVRLPDGGTERTQGEAYIRSVRAADPLLERIRSTSATFLEAAKANDARKLAAAGNDVRTALDAFRSARAESDAMAVAYGFNLCGNLN
ncbi:MAG: hypothetical protein Q8O56_17710 [Solirubrobacteraceae bacterium]|nr:hypothetical protein [Solirubrobacteraceae bacterium]